MSSQKEWKKAWGEYRLDRKNRSTNLIPKRRSKEYLKFQPTFIRLRMVLGSKLQVDSRINKRSPLHVLRVLNYVNYLGDISKFNVYMMYSVPEVKVRSNLIESGFLPGIDEIRPSGKYWGD